MDYKLKTLSALLVISTLTACGGGGSSDTAATTTSTANTQSSGVDILAQRSTTNTATSTNLSIDQINTYSADAAYNTINSHRTTCKFNSLTRDSRLNEVAASHASYLVANSEVLTAKGVYGHTEPFSDLSYFTGDKVNTRAENKGYYLNVALGARINDTLVSFDNVTPDASVGTEAAYKLMSAPYHMVAIFDAFSDVGTAQKHSSNFGLKTNKTVVNVVVARQASSTTDIKTSTEVNTFPCNGTAGVPTQLLNEIPNPVPSRNLATNPIGQPIFFRSASGTELKLLNITVTDDKGQAVELLPTLDVSSDTNKMLYKNEVFVMPSGPLTAYTTYTVNATVTVNGVNKIIPSYTFATGAKNSI